MTINDRGKKTLLDASDTLARRKLLSVAGAGRIDGKHQPWSPACSV